MAARVRKPRRPPAKAEELPDPVGDYARAVIAGDVVAGKWVRLACQRHLRDLETAAAHGWRFDRRLALRAIMFFPTVLRHYKGRWGRGSAEHPSGEPFVLQPWQEFIVGCLFGWVSAATGLRRFRLAYIEIARKNGKSALCAGLGLLLFMFDEEPGAEVYTAATKREQAQIIWGDAEQFVRRSQALSRRVECLSLVMLHRPSASKFAPLSADDKTMDGLNPHGVLIDELHAHPTRKIVDVMTTAQGSREQPLQVEITTAGKEVESVCYEHHDYSEKVLEGVFDDDTWFAFVAALDKDDDWKDEAVWVKANPNLGVSKDLDYLRTEVRRAVNQPSAAPTVKRLHFDIWTEEAGGWMDMTRWNACGEAIDWPALKGRPCYGGMDLSSTTDITALALVYPPTASDCRVYVRPIFFVPEAKVRAAASGEFGDKVPYHLWAERGLVTATPGDVVDYDAVIAALIAERDAGADIREVGFDTWNATATANHLAAAGFTMIEVRQGYKTMSEPMKRLERLVFQGRLRHGGHPVLRWMAANTAAVKDDAENIKPSKRLSRQKIDGIVATIMALSRVIANDGLKDESPYEGKDLLVL